MEERGRFSCGDVYHERHHILPECCGGKSTKENLIDLFPREYFIAHKLLVEENPDNEKLIYALAIMSFCPGYQGQRYICAPEEYENARMAFSTMLKERYKNKDNHPSYGTHISEERKNIISKANKGNKYCVGRVLSETTKKKIGDANRNPSDVTRKKMSESRKGRGLGSENPNAKAVVRLSDGKVYSCVKDAASDNGINYSSFKSMVRRNKNFMYYNESVEQI